MKKKTTYQKIAKKNAPHLNRSPVTNKSNQVRKRNQINSIIPNHPHHFNTISLLTPSANRIQPKLKINTPNDKYEQEADSVAAQVMETTTPSIQTKSESDSGRLASPAFTHQILNTSHQGEPLGSNTQSFMESKFGQNFSQVRIHQGHSAAEMNKEINAQAFTRGQDIYFNQNKYQPETREGKQLLAHELTHTIQQGNGHASDSIQRNGNGDEKKPAKDKKAAKTKVEVVAEHDLSEEQTKASTTQSGEEKVTKSVTATAETKTTGDGTTGTAGLKVKDKKSGLSASGGIKAESPADPAMADSAKGFIKVGGKWTLFDSSLQLSTGASLETDFTKTPKLSADGKAVFIPDGVVSPEIVAGIVYERKYDPTKPDLVGSIGGGLNFQLTDFLSAKTGLTVSIGSDNKVHTKVGGGLVFSF